MVATQFSPDLGGDLRLSYLTLNHLKFFVAPPTEKTNEIFTDNPIRQRVASLLMS